ncbi:MAG: metal-dependent hydrolase [Planctomycetes bacterium]|nr:metal-dependent hydrolase [Planctomycetota bacterium]
MDSVSQFALGAAVTAAVLGGRCPAGRAVLIGGLVATLPDLDVLIDHGDAVANMTMHRAESHALLWLAAATPLLAWLISRLRGQREHFGRWCLAVLLTLWTHVGLDALTIYGTQLALPFTDHPFGLGCIFVIDPLYTLPLLLGIGLLCWRRGDRSGVRANLVGLLLSTGYAAWSFGAQQHVVRLAREELARQGIVAEQMLVTPAPLQTVLWRVVAVDAGAFYEGSHSLFDSGAHIAFERFDRGAALFAALRDDPVVARLARFSHGMFRLRRVGDEVFMADLRMGQQPFFPFDFRVAGSHPDGALAALPPQRTAARLDVGVAASWIWRRMWGEAVPPPR